MDIAGSIATVPAFIFTAITFWVIFPRTRKSDQVKIASDINKELTEIVLDIPEDIAHKKGLYEHFKPNLMRP
jgi:hypothetical protein